ncbi:MAG: hypothetical protein ACC646_13155, partial [Paracoccaceae bacterium]
DIPGLICQSGQMSNTKYFAFAAGLVMTAGAAFAQPPVIDAVKADKIGAGWSFAATISHPEPGWEHYADGWEVLDMNGASLGLRVLVHPHVNEQPFTRSLSGVVIAPGTRQVQIRASDNVDGWTSDLFLLSLQN